MNFSLLHKRKQCDLTCLLNRNSKLTLVHCACARCSAWQNLAALGKIAAQFCCIFSIVDVLAFVNTELANFFALAAAACSIVSLLAKMLLPPVMRIINYDLPCKS